MEDMSYTLSKIFRAPGLQSKSVDLGICNNPHKARKFEGALNPIQDLMVFSFQTASGLVGYGCEASCTILATGVEHQFFKRGWVNR